MTPAVNQIELHPCLTQRALSEFCFGRGIAVEAWSTIAQGGVLNDRAIQELAQRSW